MRLHAFEHDAMEGIGTIADWAAERGASVSRTRWYAGETAPDPSQWDLLVVMGGPMNIYEHDAHPWLVAEKEALRVAAASDKPILGICLGSQLLADVLGGRVVRNPETEIGWIPVETSEEFRAGRFGDVFPGRFEPFHWHGDTFELPEGATRLGSSPACRNQGFTLGNVVGLQFHVEFAAAGLGALIDAQDSWEGRWVQRPETFLARREAFAALPPLRDALLDALAGL